MGVCVFVCVCNGSNPNDSDTDKSRGHPNALSIPHHQGSDFRLHIIVFGCTYVGLDQELDQQRAYPSCPHWSHL